MELHENPYLQPEDYAAGYRESIEKLKNNPELLSFEKLAYEVFNTEAGKRMIEYVKERWIIPSLVSTQSANYTDAVVWSEGFKDFPRMLINCIRSHEQRIQAEGTK